MPTQVLPIPDLAKLGVVIDTPSVSLPPNVFSQVRNVRFHDGSIRKMSGEDAILINVGDNRIIYSAYWPLPGETKYLIVVATNGTRDYVYTFSTSSLTASGTADPVGGAASTDNLQTNVQYDVPTGGMWQHTLFGGGSTMILNNGISTPKYSHHPMQSFYDLPGWDSYLIDEQVFSVIYDTSSIPSDGGINLGQFVNLPDTDGELTNLPSTITNRMNQTITMSVIPADTAIAAFAARIDDYNATATPSIYNDIATVAFDANTGTTVITPRARVVAADGSVTTQGVLNGDTVTFTITTTPLIRVTARVLRSYGNLLVAGSLQEFQRNSDGTTSATVLRDMPGVVRTSDVAAAGSIPSNWNPFHNGVNTAEEFTISATSLIQDMAELQGIMYIYTNDSIHSMQATGNPVVPFNVRPVAKGWGAQTVDAVQEFDGKHVVVGSSDIYIFAGHPGSITSIADGRVRQQFFDDLTTDATHQRNLFTLLYRKEDELWINYPDRRGNNPNGACNKSLIWNYRHNTWTIRDMSDFFNGDMTPIQHDGTIDSNNYFPMMTSTNNTIFVVDSPTSFSTHGNQPYESFVERERLAMTPEFDTENLASIALLVDGGAVLSITVRGSMNPGDVVGSAGGSTFDFDTNEDYKTDIRVHGRFLNYKIGDDGTAADSNEPTTEGWRLSGMQFDIGKGGQR